MFSSLPQYYKDKKIVRKENVFLSLFLFYNISMNKQELKSKIAQINDEKRISFSIGDEILSNHFDRDDENRMTSEDISTSLAYTIYSWIANSIVFKAQGKESSQKGYLYFKEEWDKIVKNQKENLTIESKTEEENALLLLNQFFENKKQVLLPEMIAKFAPIAVLSLMMKDEKESKSIIKEFNKNKEIIFNQVVLFSRSLFHSFLNKTGIESNKVRPDYASLNNGIFLYQGKTLIVPTWQNAFTLSAYKEVILNGIDSLSDNFPISDIDSIAVIYLVKDIFAGCTL